MAKGDLFFSKSYDGVTIPNAQVSFKYLKKYPGFLEYDMSATRAAWGFMGSHPDSAVTMSLKKRYNPPLIVLNKMKKDRDSALLLWEGILTVKRGGKIDTIGLFRVYCRACKNPTKAQECDSL